MKAYTDLLNAFWMNVTPAKGCWLWQGTINKLRGGYGQLKYRRRVYRAHRVAWQLAYGKIPAGKVICHHCDTPACVRLSHLFLGSQDDNLKDAVRKKRMASGKNHGLQRHPEARAWGQRNGMARLTNTTAQRLRELFHRGTPATTLARQFHVHWRTVYRIANGEHYARYTV